MRRIVAASFLVAMLICLSACGGKVSDAQTLEYHSDVYTDAQINDAIQVTRRYFRKEFSGCTLVDITYLGDDKQADFQDWADRNDADQVIVLVSTFTVDASGGDGSLNPNSTYTNWKWILVRNDGGKWRHVDHGY